MDSIEQLATAPFLVVGELAGSAAAGRITLAAELPHDELAAIAADRITDETTLTFDRVAGAVRARQERRLDALVLEARPVPIPARADTAAVLCAGITQLGLDSLAWSKTQRHLLARIRFLHAAKPDAAPDLSDGMLMKHLGDWLGPFLQGKTAISEISAGDLEAALAALIPWDARQQADTEAPTHFTAPTGNRHPIDYEGEGAPKVALRVQELFGMKSHPAIADGRLPLTLELLSPAGRPIQITRDLPGFWAGSWRDVAAEMKGRYPKHPWPDAPADAEPTARAKPRKR